MPQFTATASLGAGATAAPLTGWEYEYLPFPAHVRVITDCTATGMVKTVKAGSETIVSECPLKLGGTAGAFLTEFGCTPIDFNAAAGDKLAVIFRNTSGGAISYNLEIIVNPIA